VDITDENDGHTKAYNFSRGFVRSFERAEMQSGMGTRGTSRCIFFRAKLSPDFPIAGRLECTKDEMFVLKTVQTGNNDKKTSEKWKKSS